MQMLSTDLFIPDDKLAGVCAILLNHMGNVLSVSRRGKPTDLGLPGGKLNENERAFEAVAREVKEEVCVDAPASDYEALCEIRDINDPQQIVRHYRCIRFVEMIPRAGEEGFHAGWNPPSRLTQHSNTFGRNLERLFQCFPVTPGLLADMRQRAPLVIK